MFSVASFYRFVTIDDPDALIEWFRELCTANDVRGSIIVAEEGINGMLAGSDAGMATVHEAFQGVDALRDLPYRRSEHDEIPFKRLLLKRKSEIVTMGQPDLEIVGNTGTYVAPKDWDTLINRDDVTLIDTRNDYECDEGIFDGAVDPKIGCFRDFPAWVDDNLDPTKQPAVAMYCTGGIRCEKATALMKAKGFKEVYHLQGGILNYFEHTKNETGAWNGTCFVFDERETVDAELEPAPATSRLAFPRPKRGKADI